MTGERTFSIVNLFFKITAIILVTVGIYFFATTFINFIKNNGKKYDESNLDVLLQDFRNLFSENKNYAFLAIAGIILAYLTYIFDIIILSIASWKSQVIGKVILLLSTIFPIPMWAISWLGNIFIAVKKREKTI